MAVAILVVFAKWPRDDNANRMVPTIAGTVKAPLHPTTQIILQIAQGRLTKKNKGNQRFEKNDISGALEICKLNVTDSQEREECLEILSLNLYGVYHKDAKANPSPDAPRVEYYLAGVTFDEFEMIVNEMIKPVTKARAYQGISLFFQNAGDEMSAKKAQDRALENAKVADVERRQAEWWGRAKAWAETAGAWIIAALTLICGLIGLILKSAVESATKLAVESAAEKMKQKNPDQLSPPKAKEGPSGISSTNAVE